MPQMSTDATSPPNGGPSAAVTPTALASAETVTRDVRAVKKSTGPIAPLRLRVTAAGPPVAVRSVAQEKGTVGDNAAEVESGVRQAGEAAQPETVDAQQQQTAQRQRTAEEESGAMQAVANDGKVERAEGPLAPQGVGLASTGATRGQEAEQRAGGEAEHPQGAEQDTSGEVLSEEWEEWDAVENGQVPSGDAVKLAQGPNGGEEAGSEGMSAMHAGAVDEAEGDDGNGVQRAARSTPASDDVSLPHKR